MTRTSSSYMSLTNCCAGSTPCTVSEPIERSLTRATMPLATPTLTSASTRARLTSRSADPSDFSVSFLRPCSPPEIVEIASVSVSKK